MVDFGLPNILMLYSLANEEEQVEIWVSIERLHEKNLGVEQWVYWYGGARLYVSCSLRIQQISYQYARFYSS